MGAHWATQNRGSLHDFSVQENVREQQPDRLELGQLRCLLVREVSPLCVFRVPKAGDFRVPEAAASDFDTSPKAVRAYRSLPCESEHSERYKSLSPSPAINLRSGCASETAQPRTLQDFNGKNIHSKYVREALWLNRRQHQIE